MAKSNVLIKSKLKKARALVAQNDLVAAKNAYYKLYAKNKTIHSIGIELAVVCRKLGEFQETEKLTKNIIDMSPNLAMAHHVYGSALQCLGSYDAAIASYKRAIELDSKLAEAHYFLGNLYQLTGNTDAAAECFYKAIEIRPDFYEALNNLGAALIELNRPIDAKDIIDRAMKINPESIQLLCNVAGFYFLDNSLDKALAYAMRAYNIDANFVDALKLLGKIYYQKSDYDQALHFYEKAYGLSNDKKLIAHIAQILERRGEFDRSRDLIMPVIESGEPDVTALLTYSALSREYNNQEEAVQLLEGSIKNMNLDDAALISLHAELGKQYDALKKYDNAFSNYDRANKIERKLNAQFEVINNMKQLDNTRPADIENWMTKFDGVYWDEIPSSEHPSHRPIFIVGMFRSGTTLCEQILSSHPEVHGAGELPDISALSYSLQTTPEKLHDKSPASLENVTKEELYTAAEKYLETLNRYSTSAEFVVDKMPANFFHVGLILKMFPNAHIVHMMRDPRDTCLSMYFQRFGPQMTATTDLIELADYYLTYQHLMKYWNDLFGVKIHNVMYEELMENQESVTRGMLEFCGLEWDAKCLNFHKNKRDVNTPSYDQVRKPLYKKSVARWKNYEQYLQPLIVRLGL